MKNATDTSGGTGASVSIAGSVLMIEWQLAFTPGLDWPLCLWLACLARGSDTTREGRMKETTPWKGRHWNEDKTLNPVLVTAVAALGSRTASDAAVTVEVA
jgi:hypothetical protein